MLLVVTLAGVNSCASFSSLALALVLGVAPIAAQPSSGNAPAPAPVACEQGFNVYNSAGEPLSWDAMLQDAKAADAVFLGENHDDRRGHCLQDRIFRALHQAVSPRPVVLAMEMFERDTQTVLDEYLHGLIDERLFLAASRPWKNYKEDYRPLIEYAREHRIPVVAANAPRRYVTITARKGPQVLSELSAEARSWLPPLPLAPPSDAYRAQFNDVMGNLNPAGPCADPDELARGARKPDPHKPAASHGGGQAPAGAKPAMPSMANLIESQSLWDASMAYAVAEALRQHPGALVVHLNGAFHTENEMGILERLSSYRPGTRTYVIGFYPRPDYQAFDEDLSGASPAIVQTDCAAYRKQD